MNINKIITKLDSHGLAKVMPKVAKSGLYPELVKEYYDMWGKKYLSAAQKIQDFNEFFIKFKETLTTDLHKVQKSNEDCVMTDKPKPLHILLEAAREFATTDNVYDYVKVIEAQHFEIAEHAFSCGFLAAAGNTPGSINNISNNHAETWKLYKKLHLTY